jgi:hypothetical protein
MHTDHASYERQVAEIYEPLAQHPNEMHGGSKTFVFLSIAEPDNVAMTDRKTLAA